MKCQHLRRVVELLTFIIVIILRVPQVPGQLCSQRNITNSTSPPDPSNCVNIKSLGQTDRAQAGDAFSFGNLDDFCLITRTSTISVHTSSSLPPYDGIGAKQFPILNKLVQGRTWSYNAFNRLDVANIDFKQIQDIYYAQYQKHVVKVQNDILKVNFSLVEANATAHRIDKTVFTSLLSPISTTIWNPFQNAIKEQAGAQAAVDKYNGCSATQPHLCGGPSGEEKERLKVANLRVTRYNATQIQAKDETKRLDTRLKDLQKQLADTQIILPPYGNLINELERLKDETPDYEAPNPYFIETSAIKVDGEVLKNYLHFRVFMNGSVADQFSRLHTAQERRNNARGRMIALLIMVKDQDGWPVGDFSHAIPCSKTCKDYGKNVYSHHDRNDVPCAYTPPTSTTQPGMFIFPKDGEETSEGHQEIHATWSFVQDSCNFVTKLHIQTLILEDKKERPGPDSYYDLEVDVLKRNKVANTNPEPRRHFYGWTARYDLLHPTIKSLGSPDYVSISRLKDRDNRGSFIDCHVPLKEEHGFIKGVAPKGTEIPSVASYFLAVQGQYDSSIQFYGQHTSSEFTKCREPGPLPRHPESQTTEKFRSIESISNYLDTPGLFCPCPALPTSPRPEDQTPNPSRLHGRLLHGSHMAMAWMVLVPLSWFVARYYKETFASLFCLQEYWWYMWHVGLIFTAAVFGLGGFVSIQSRARLETLAHTDEWIVHTVLGFISFVLFYVQIISGFFRFKDPVKRKRQILAHFAMGLVNQLSAIAGIVVVAFVKASGLSCNGIYTIAGWIAFWFVMFGLMEWQTHLMDKKMKLTPPRSYLPPPVKRLFGQDAPGRGFRAVMLVLFIVGQFLFYWCLNSFIWNSGGQSCRDEVGESESSTELSAVVYYDESDKLDYY